MKMHEAPVAVSDRRRLIALALGLMTLVVYLPVGDHFFVRMDDGDYIMENPRVLGGLTWTNIHWAFTSFHASNWHPLTWLSHMLDCELFGTFAGAHHLVSVVLHAINAVLLFVVWNRFTGKTWPAAFIAALFALHPLNVETVAWASERKNVLGIFFFLLTLLAYGDFVKTAPAKGRNALAGLFQNRNGLLVLLFFALGLMSKPVVVTLPFVLVLLDFWPLRRVSGGGRPLADALMEKAPLFLLTLLSCVVTFASERQESVIALEHLPASHRLVVAVLGYHGYLAKAFWPVDLAAFYPFHSHVRPATVLLAVLVLLAVSAAAVGLRKKSPALLLGWCWFLGTLVPVIGLVQIGSQAMADRHAYLSLIGIFVMVAFGTTDLVRTRLHRGLAAAGGIALLGCLLVTRHQLAFWKDSEALFRRAIAVTEGNAKAEAGLAFSLHMRGSSEEAVEHFRTAIQLAPNDAANYNNLAIVLETLGRHEEAIRLHRDAVRLQPGDAKYHCNLGILLARDRHYEEAFACFHEAHRLSPRHPKPYLEMGRAGLAQGRSHEAVRYFRDALNLAPDDLETLAALSQVLATDADAEIRNGPEAVRLAERAAGLNVGGQIAVFDVLAMAYAEAGRYDEATSTLSNVLAQISGAETNAAFAELQSRLRLYESHQPFRAPKPSP
ncbi:MAG: tetratricopeptide repeat protein [Verrucomicrobiota bacterium]